MSDGATAAQMTPAGSGEPTSPAPGTPEYDAAMVARYEKGLGLPEDERQPERFVRQRPENVPEKFWDPQTGQVKLDDVLKSYAALEQRLAQQSQQQRPPAQQQQQQQADPAQQAVERAGLNWEAVSNEFRSTGNIGDQTRAALNKSGIPNEIIDEYLELAAFRAEAHLKEQFAYAGGEEPAKELLSWAAQNLSPDQIAAYNEMLAGPNWKAAFDALKAERASRRKNAGEPNFLSGAPAGGPGGTAGFQSRREMTTAINDPRYRTDPAYRQMVMRRVAMSNFDADARGF